MFEKYKGKLVVVEEKMKEQILSGEFYIVDDGTDEFIVRDEDIAKVIALLPASCKATVYDSDFNIVTTTYGSFLDRTDASFREKIIEGLIKYQRGEEEIGSVLILSVNALETFDEDNDTEKTQFEPFVKDFGYGPISLYSQEQEGNYNFHVRPMVTRGFQSLFGDLTALAVQNCLSMIEERFEKPDYLQVFSYEGTKFYCIADFERGVVAEDYEGIPYLYVTFLLPEER